MLHDPSLSELAEKSAPLREYAVQFRYPEEDEPPTARQARSGLSLAKKVHREILKRLPEECRV